MPDRSGGQRQRLRGFRHRRTGRSVVKFVRWKQDGAWLGYLQQYPDYWTQGNSLKDLKEHLKDLYRDITSGRVPSIRKVEELVVS